MTKQTRRKFTPEFKVWYPKKEKIATFMTRKVRIPVSANDISYPNPFGMMIEGRSWQAGSAYRYGFNGQEGDNEIEGNGNRVNFRFRMYDSRLGRFFAIDPLEAVYPYYTPYQFAGNMPVFTDDLEGMEPRRKLCPYNRNKWSFHKALFHLRGQKNVRQGKRRGLFGSRKSKNRRTASDIQVDGGNPPSNQNPRDEGSNNSTPTQTPTAPPPVPVSQTPTKSPPPTPCTTTETNTQTQTDVHFGGNIIRRSRINYQPNAPLFNSDADRNLVNNIARLALANTNHVVNSFTATVPSAPNCTTVEDVTVTTVTSTNITIGIWTQARALSPTSVGNGMQMSIARFNLVSQQLQAMGVPANNINWGWFRFGLARNQMGGRVNLTTFNITTSTTTTITTNRTTTCVVPCP